MNPIYIYIIADLAGSALLLLGFFVGLRYARLTAPAPVHDCCCSQHCFYED